MKTVLKLSLCALSLTAHADLYTPPYISISAGSDYICATDPQTTEAKCQVQYRGDMSPPQPALKNVKMVSSGSHDACAINDKDIQCWGYSVKTYPEKYKYPELRHPKFVSTGTYVTCVIDDDGLKCFGRDQYGLLDYPKLRKPTEVSVGTFHACAIEAGEVHCWGAKDPHKNLYVGDHGQTKKMTGLKNPRSLGVGQYHNCVLDDEGVHCWGDDSNDKLKIPPLDQPTMVSVGEYLSCAVDRNGVQCWGDLSCLPVNSPFAAGTYSLFPGRYMKIPEARNIIYVTVGAHRVCGLTKQGRVRCWEDSDRGTLDFNYALSRDLILSDVTQPGAPRVERPRFALDQLVDLQALLVRVGSPAKSQYFAGLAKFLGEELSAPVRADDMNLSRYLALKLMSPAIEAESSAYFTRTLVPQFNWSMDNISRELGVESLKAAPTTTRNRRMALWSIHSALKVASQFTDSTQVDQFNAIQRTVGLAISNPVADRVQAVVEKLEAEQGLLARIEANPKAKFLVDLVNLAKDYLRTQ